MVRACLAVLLAVLSLPTALAQQPVMPGKEHQFFKELAGEWEVVFDGNMKGKATYEMKHNDLWLESKVEMDMPQGKFTGTGLDSYDATKKKYVAIWIDSMSTSPIVLEGDMDSATKTLTMRGKGPDNDGKIVDYKMSTEYKDKNTHIFKMWIGDLQGKPTMTATYSRKK